ncbi:hypothetical protein BDP27DRAFT_1446807 [Rhodocollybia butyracea]|uniref:Uncharacterized protein n=1 Tax=Rhodocollybia butyracea TaxID=206335 RepID=A0A9P5U970_9AGAR|nr:hypothetical protein BDP27DRAFT_1446807 [Rhodocollybia butyracea]
MSSSSLSDEELAEINSVLGFVYVVQMTAAIMIWDIVLHVADDVELLLPSLSGRFRPPTVVYFLSRVFFLLYACVVLAFNAKTCEPSLILVATASNMIATILTLFQFFLRVRVIYCEGSPFKTGFFAMLWLLASGGVSFILDFDENIGCTTRPVDFSFWVPILSILVHDSCVFLAISYQIYKLSLLFAYTNSQFSPFGVEFGGRSGIGPSLMQSLKARILVLAGKELSSFTRAILQDGQFYYLISVASSVATLALLLNTSLLPTSRQLLIPVHSVLINITAGHVFREGSLLPLRNLVFLVPSTSPSKLVLNRESDKFHLNAQLSAVPTCSFGHFDITPDYSQTNTIRFVLGYATERPLISMSSPSDEELATLQSGFAFSYAIQIAGTIMIWDIVIHSGDDVELLFLPGRFRPPTVVYFLSRFLFLIYSSFLTQTADSSKTCSSSLTLAASATNIFALAFTLFQFFLRVRVIYCEGSRLKTGFFAMLWVFASGAIAYNLGFNGREPRCAHHQTINFRFWAPVLAILVHDSCVFLAISYQIYKLSLVLVRTNPRFNPSGVEFGGRTRSSLVQSFKARAVALAGKELPSLFRAILYNGQFYYLISVASGLTTLTLLFNTSLLPAYRSLLVPMHSVLVNITAGHVFREARLGRIRERELTLAFQQSIMEENLSLHSIHRDEEKEEAPSWTLQTGNC